MQKGLVLLQKGLIAQPPKKGVDQSFSEKDQFTAKKCRIVIKNPKQGLVLLKRTSFLTRPFLPILSFSLYLSHFSKMGTSPFDGTSPFQSNLYGGLVPFTVTPVFCRRTSPFYQGLVLLYILVQHLYLGLVLIHESFGNHLLLLRTSPYM